MVRSSLSMADRAAQVLIVVAVSLMLASLGGMLPGWMPRTGSFAAVALAVALARHGMRTFRTAGMQQPLTLIRRYSFAMGLTLVATAGLVVRLLGIGHGPGHVPTDIDENRLALSVMHFFQTGTIEHDTVEHYPGIQFWLLAGSFLMTYLWGLMTETVRSFGETGTDPFVIAGRVTNAFLEFGTIALTGLIGRSLAGPAAGLLSAGLLAGAPLAIIISSQLRNEAALVVCVVAATYIAIVGSQSATRRPALVGGACAGLAAAIKYSGVFALLPVVIAGAYAGTAKERVTRIGFSVLGFVAALAITNHFLWADFSNFIRQLSTEVTMTGAGHWAAMSNPRWFYPQTLAGLGFGWPIVAVAAGYSVYALSTGHRHGVLLLAFPLTYFWFMASRPAQFPRWAYTMTPFVAVAGVAGLWTLRDMLQRIVPRERSGLVRVAVGTLGVVCAVPFVLMSANEIGRRPAAPPYALAEAWLATSGSPGDRVLSENSWLDLRASGLTVERVNDLSRSLNASDHELNTFQWIVVPEIYFGDPNVKRLALAQAFSADRRFGGNAGEDIRVYTAPPLPPLDASNIEIGTPAAAEFLGLGWQDDKTGQPGAVLSDQGGRIYVPASTREKTRFEFEILAGKTLAEWTGSPIELRVDGAPIALEVVSSANGRVRLLSADVPRPAARVKVSTLSLQPRPGSGPIRVLRCIPREGSAVSRPASHG